MPRIRRGGFIFLEQIADHAPRHVHIYRDGKLVAKFDLENRLAMKGAMNSRLLKIVEALEKEGVL